MEASFKSPMSVHFIGKHCSQNWFSVVMFYWGIPVYTRALPLSYPSTWTQLMVLPPHISPYLWYWIVVANGEHRMPSVCYTCPCSVQLFLLQCDYQGDKDKKDPHIFELLCYALDSSYAQNYSGGSVR